MRPISDIAARLRAAGCVFADEEAELLVGAAAADAELEELARRREGGEPLEHVLGWAELGGTRVRVGPGVFVPRARSGLLLQEGTALLRDGAVVAELCCGSGAIALALAEADRRIELHAADLDPVAVRCAEENLAGVGAVHRGDLYDALPPELRGRVDLVVANAPYVPTGELAMLPREARDHEPALALDGGADGLDPHRRLAAEAREWLAPGGTLMFEVSPEQAPAAMDIVIGAGLVARTALDDDLEVAVVSGTAPRAS